MSVSIIILTYNSSRHIEGLLESIKGFAKNHEVLVIDNDSKDDTLKLAGKFDFVKTINTGGNLGFAKGINFGVKQAKGDYALFINPDTIYKLGSIDSLLKAFDDKTGVVGGKLIDPSGKAEKSCGKFFGIWATTLMALGIDEILGVRFSPDREKHVDFVSGGFMMVKKSVFQKIGGFDPNYFMYVEDMDLCYRLKKAGFNTKFTPDVVFIHVGQGSSNRSFAIQNIYKGLLHFHVNKGAIDYHAAALVLFLKAFTVYLLGKITNNSYYISTYGEVLKLF
jgi:GT2 family glycosyltransferase